MAQNNDTQKFIQKPEPEHSCCTRVLMCPLAAISVVPAAAILPPLIIASPIRFVALVCCHVACCKCLCPDNVEQCMKNFVCTPCRWGRIACIGKGQIGCCEYPAWPFN